MKTINREVCPHCGQTINERKVQLSSTLVDALWRVYMYSVRENKKRFLREEIKHLFTGNETVTANFAYWKWFSSKGITGKKGEYILDWDVLDRFFSGKATVPSEIWVKGTGKKTS